MSGQLLVGAGKEIHSRPDAELRTALEHIPQAMKKRLAFMTADHHAVRDCAVRELPRQGRPLSPGQIAAITGIARQKISTILAELEGNLFFLVRDSNGDVSWAFPVTAARTAHRLSFSTGERTFGA